MKEGDWWSKNIFELKNAWVKSGGLWTDQECRIIEARELERQLEERPSRDTATAPSNTEA